MDPWRIPTTERLLDRRLREDPCRHRKESQLRRRHAIKTTTRSIQRDMDNLIHTPVSNPKPINILAIPSNLTMSITKNRHRRRIEDIQRNRLPEQPHHLNIRITKKHQARDRHPKQLNNVLSRIRKPHQPTKPNHLIRLRRNLILRNIRIRNNLQIPRRHRPSNHTNRRRHPRTRPIRIMKLLQHLLTLSRRRHLSRRHLRTQRNTELKTTTPNLRCRELRHQRSRRLYDTAGY